MPKIPPGVELFRDWMRRRGFTQADAARYFGWSEPYMSNLLKTGEVGLSVAVKIQRLAGIHVEAWLNVSELDEMMVAASAEPSNRRIGK